VTSAHRFVNPEGLMPASGFSHVAVPAPGRTVYIAGQTAHGVDGTVRGTTMAEQAAAALRNMATAVAAAGAQPQDLVSVQIYVTDVAAYRDGLAQIGAAWQEHLGKHYPAISLFGVAALFDPDAMIEIVGTAVIPRTD
jgi:enamine deaminase RidA (YjgF/YER057c/UK114 family)